MHIRRVWLKQRLGLRTSLACFLGEAACSNCHLQAARFPSSGHHLAEIFTSLLLLLASTAFKMPFAGHTCHPSIASNCAYVREGNCGQPAWYASRAPCLASLRGFPPFFTLNSADTSPPVHLFYSCPGKRLSFPASDASLGETLLMAVCLRATQARMRPGVRNEHRPYRQASSSFRDILPCEVHTVFCMKFELIVKQIGPFRSACNSDSTKVMRSISHSRCIF